jgi:hypothetical protein
MESMYRCAVVLLVAAACSDPADSISFDDSEGLGDDLDRCDCQYYDSSEGDEPSLQLTCFGDIAVSFFLDPRVMETEQGVSLIFEPDAGAFGAAGFGSFHSLGPERRADHKIVRSLDGVTLRWSEQDACDAASGCSAGMYHLQSGALRGGSGGCKDFWATVDHG